jgi:hypothetical protein
MRTLIVSVLFLALSTAAFAETNCSESAESSYVDAAYELTTDVPNYLKGAKITVRLADGRESTVPAERFKVVPRKQQFLAKVIKTEKTVSCITNTPRKNRVSVLGGHGAQEGLKSTASGSSTTVESNVGLVGGAQYQRMIGERWSLGVQGQTNKTGSLLLGIEFYYKEINPDLNLGSGFYLFYENETATMEWT